MPRASREQMALHRQAIEDTASRLFRERGFNNVSIQDIMKAVGLTHGGFYNHFESKDELVAIAYKNAFDKSQERWQQRIAERSPAKNELAAILDPYFTDQWLRSIGDACPLTALSVDIARTTSEAEQQPARHNYNQGLKGLMAILQDAIAKQHASQTEHAAAPDDSRQKAMIMLANMSGALILARALHDDPLAKEMLDTVKQHLLHDF
jgi:TetR/AcrR family transcriptional repressor of nem operon